MKLIYTSIIFSVLFVYITSARPWRVDQIPNGSVNSCANCHINVAGGGPRNPFGQTVESQFLKNDDVVWGKQLAEIDSDEDGFTNGQELGDPEGNWQVGLPQPGNPNDVTLPGDPADHPTFVFENDYNSVNKTLTFINMWPNPCYGTTNFSFNLKKSSYALVTAYNSHGELVGNLFDGFLPAGENNLKMEIKNSFGLIAEPGVYFIWVSAGEASMVSKVVIL